jgi:hypothetical protein
VNHGPWDRSNARIRNVDDPVVTWLQRNRHVLSRETRLMEHIENVAARRQLEKIPVVESNGLFRDGPCGEHVMHYTGAV